MCFGLIHDKQGAGRVRVAGRNCCTGNGECRTEWRWFLGHSMTVGKGMLWRLWAETTAKVTASAAPREDGFWAVTAAKETASTALSEDGFLGRSMTVGKFMLCKLRAETAAKVTASAATSEDGCWTAT